MTDAPITLDLASDELDDNALDAIADLLIEQHERRSGPDTPTTAVAPRFERSIALPLKKAPRLNQVWKG